MDELVERNDFFYKQFTDIPYTGKVTGVEQGFFKNGKKDGAWVGYHENGQLKYKGIFNNGKLKGAWVEYYENGQLLSKINYKNGEAEGAWVEYYDDGTLKKKGSYKNGKFASDTPLSMLVMVFDKDCWVEIKDGRGKMVLSDLYGSGSKIEQLVVSPIEVLLGRSSGVTKMMFHGETIDLKPHTRKDIARLTLTRH